MFQGHRVDFQVAHGSKFSFPLHFPPLDPECLGQLKSAVKTIKVGGRVRWPFRVGEKQGFSTHLTGIAKYTQFNHYELKRSLSIDIKIETTHKIA